jgi:HD superfamily phosphodiesterase
MKVYTIARTIGINERLPEDVQHLVEIAAITHDIGIKLSEEKFGSAAGEYQEQEGPAEAEKLLSELGFEEEFIDKVCYLIAHHHTYKGIDNLPFRILVEADFLVNIYEEHISMELAKGIKTNIFRTESGKKMLEQMYGI